MGECGFAHLFEKEGFIDALPQGRVQIESQERPLLEGAANEGAGADGLFAALMGSGQQMLEATTVRLLNAA